MPLTVVSKIPYGKKRYERFSLFASGRRSPLVVLVPGRWQQIPERAAYFTVARALVEDGMTVAVVDYSPLSAGWGQTQLDLQHALVAIVREAVAMGGNAENLVLWCEGLGAFMITQMIYSCIKGIWQLPSQSSISGWLAVDGYWSEENIQQLPARHPLRQLFPDARSWQEQHLAFTSDRPLPPGLIVHLGQSASAGAGSGAASALSATESFVNRGVQLGNDMTLLTRPEESKRIWRNIEKSDHPLRVTWRPWLQRVTRC